MTRRQPVEPTPGQLDLFGTTGTTESSASGPVSARPAVAETNDLDLIGHVSGNAARGVYVLVGAAERVYARTDGPDSRDVVRVPRYEEAAVHQLLRRGCLTQGANHHGLSCGAATLTGTAVNCPKATHARVRHWEALTRPTTWTPTPPAGRAHLRIVGKDSRA